VKDNQDEKLDVITRLEKVNKLLTYAVMLDSFIVVYIQFVIMLTELQKVLCLELECLCAKTVTVLSEQTAWMLVHYYCFRNTQVNPQCDP